jgi:hypothetical protein
MAVERSKPQQMNPTPMGRIPLGTSVIGSDWRDNVVEVRRDEKLLGSVPAPRKPRPPDRETATTRRSEDINRIGADAMRGAAVQG